MCSHQTLYYEDNIGYVIRCAECENFQVGYGNILVTLNAADFTSFTACINRVLEMHGADGDAVSKSIFIPTPYQGLKLLLNKKELKDLCRMMDQADTEWKSQQMMDLFNHV